MGHPNEGTENPAALKEWASAVRALREGDQIVLLRKGGIAEETRDFELASPRFWLLPTYEHQREELLKPEYRHYVGESRRSWNPEAGEVPIDTFAEAVADLEISDGEMLERLKDFHIWTDRFAEERLRWKKTKPLHVLLLRVYRLERAVCIPLRPAYGGCKSWVALEDGVGAGRLEPVLSDERFEADTAAIRNALAGG